MRYLYHLGFLAAALVMSAGVCTSAVSAAITIDLTTGTGASGSANGAYFEWVDVGSTGTGVIDSFLRIQANREEKGYNTNGTLEFDTKNSHTKALPLSSVPEVEIDGVVYREFLVDIQEDTAGTDRFLSLDTVEIYLANSDSLTGYPSLGTEVFDLDDGADGDATVVMDSSLNPGNGWGDAFMYVPSSLFTGGTYVYLYSEFGGTYRSSSGPEEWAVRLGATPPVIVPAPAASLLVLAGSGLTVSLRRRRML
ncbi:MAG: hypothetical protein ACM3VT_20955 [Solirubrobacterales bacterium]